MKAVSFLFFCFNIFYLITAIKYDNYKVYSVLPQTVEQVDKLRTLNEEETYDFWTEVINIGSDVRIMVSPQKDDEFMDFLKTNKLSTSVTIPNVQRAIEEQYTPPTNNRNARNFNWGEYFDLEGIHEWLDTLAADYPDVVSTVTIGLTVEGREIKGVIINFKSDTRDDPPLIAMIEGGIHAREWISPATVTYIINEFLTSNDRNVRSLAESFVWHIFPVVNPDGYDYTFPANGNRMWRKNRNTAYNSTSCPNGNPDMSNGIDLNRNFDFNFNTVGTSANPCGETYPGPTAASELEAQAIVEHVKILREHGNMIYYFAFHSYSQMILVPYSDMTASEVLQVENYADLFEIAARGADRLEARHGTSYVVGPSAVILYGTSGGSFDWVKQEGVPIVYLYELRDVGEYGFLLPAEQIIPNGQEVMDSLIEIDRVTRQLGYYYRDSSSTVVGSFVLLIANVMYLLFRNQM